MTIDELCEITGCSRGAIRKRRKLGWSESKIRKTPCRKSSYYKRGNDNIDKLCRDNNISTSTFYRRLKNGISEHYSLTRKSRKGFKIYYIGSNLAIDVAKKFGISDSRFHYRVWKGWTIEEAAYTPLGKTKNWIHQQTEEFIKLWKKQKIKRIIKNIPNYKTYTTETIEVFI